MVEKIMHALHKMLALFRKLTSYLEDPGFAGFCCSVLSIGPLYGLVYLVADDPEGMMGPRDAIQSDAITLTLFLMFASAMICGLAKRSRPRALLFTKFLALLAASPLVISTSPDLILLPMAFVGTIWIVQHASSVLLASEKHWWVYLAWLNVLLFVLLVLLVGYELAQHFWVHVCLALLSWLALLEARFVLPPIAKFLKRHHKLGLLLRVLPLFFLVFPHLAALLVALFELALFLTLIRRFDVAAHLLDVLFERPAQMFVTSFSIIIFLGTIFLTFPISAAPNVNIGFLDAFFTSTSATCVTGLIVVDTPKAFSFFGQAVIVVLIQVGGLGMITISSFVSMSLGRRVGLKAESALGKLLDADRANVIFDLIRFIVLVTLCIEAVGAICLALIFWANGIPALTSLWYGIFHSVSAFCNAGFALFSDNLVSWNHSFSILGVISALIVLGGIGFWVLSSLYQKINGTAGPQNLPVHVRMSVWGSLILIVGGSFIMLLTEWTHSFASMSLPDRILNAVFQSITTRTAGFNSVDYTLLGSATIFAMILLMFIGACSNSTGGGVKVTTAVVMFYAVLSTIRGRPEVEAFGRTISRATVHKTIVIITLALLFISAGIFALLMTQEARFDWIIFEVFSAFGTVGLSLGLTANLDGFGKLVVIVLMFVGRVGPLTLVLILEPRKAAHYRLPEANILVG